VPLIIYGITVGVPITTLFMAGIVPGLLLVALFAVMIVLWALFDRSAAPPVVRGEARLTSDSVIDTSLVIGLVVVVIFSLYGGVATPSEIGAVGAVLAFVASLARGRMNREKLFQALTETVMVTSFIFLIVVGANALTFGFDYLKVSERLVEVVSEAAVNRWIIVSLILGLFLVLGMFLDSISMLVLTLPVIFPLSQQLGLDPVWLGIVLVVMAEIGLITPPVGMNLFILQGIGRDISLRTIAVGTLPFIALMLLLVLALCIEPGIALWLPETTN